ncbi:MAG: Metallopeptidase-like protein [Candidatus Woesebacteria bacterium GW2011_GWA1_39_21]|uniref:Metallopeptidase-like protein n=1 Tax=Candidatus Woesebacteria bacterium GW2011_GWA1_39_21 TaxID=1618550 RepID=A0A0G0QMB9_9BACT|nr:MAG: Metallopeptidase-like protein [Candidatus Woesebacteria bacterium GW2011_GWA1_39_21]
MKLKKALKFIGFKNSTKKRKKRRKSSSAVVWEKAKDIQTRIAHLIRLSHLPFAPEKISCMRSYNSKSRAYARIWGLSKVWQLSLNLKPSYVIEVLSEKFDGLPNDKKDEVLLHELAHIPNNFSGSLLPHIRHGKRSFSKKVDRLVQSVKLNLKKL